jgi:putative Mg2+ transporter-C (MgtC) family protein
VTTAAVIWVLAAIGATIGLGQFAVAVVLAVVTVAILVGVELLEVRFGWLRRGSTHTIKGAVLSGGAIQMSL